MSRRCVVKLYDAHSVIIREDDVAPELFIIKSGVVNLNKSVPESFCRPREPRRRSPGRVDDVSFEAEPPGLWVVQRNWKDLGDHHLFEPGEGTVEMLVAVLGSGQVFGELAVLDPNGRTPSSAVAVTNVEVYCLSKQALADVELLFDLPVVNYLNESLMLNNPPHKKLGSYYRNRRAWQDAKGRVLRKVMSGKWLAARAAGDAARRAERAARDRGRDRGGGGHRALRRAASEAGDGGDGGDEQLWTKRQTAARRSPAGSRRPPTERRAPPARSTSIRATFGRIDGARRALDARSTRARRTRRARARRRRVEEIRAPRRLLGELPASPEGSVASTLSGAAGSRRRTKVEDYDREAPSRKSIKQRGSLHLGRRAGPRSPGGGGESASTSSLESAAARPGDGAAAADRASLGTKAQLDAKLRRAEAAEAAKRGAAGRRRRSGALPELDRRATASSPEPPSAKKRTILE